MIMKLLYQLLRLQDAVTREPVDAALTHRIDRWRNRASLGKQRIARRCALPFLGACLWLGALDASAQSASGVTAGGQFVSSGPRGKPPWAEDIVKRVGPEYPVSQRERFNEGAGVYRGIIDVKTGLVREVVIKKSTGYPALDRSAVTALRQWRFRPGKWQAFEIPVRFGMSRSRAEAMEKMRRLRASEQW